MELKNILILEEKLLVLSEKVNNHIENKTKSIDDMELLSIMIKNHSDDLALIRLSLDNSNGELKESDFIDILQFINQFTNKALPLLK